MKSMVFAVLIAIIPICWSQSSGRPPNIVSISAEEASAHLLERVEPVYPALAKAAKIQGVVRLELTIDEGGAVSPRILSSHPLLAQAALDAVKRWKYKPFEQGGKQVVARTEIEISIPGNLDPTDERLEQEFQKTYWPAERAAKEALTAGNFVSADEQLSIALEAARKRGDSKWLETAEIVSGMCSSKLGQQKFAEAEQNCHDALNIHENHQKPDEAEVGGALMNLAMVYLAESELEKAEPLLVRCVDIYKARFKNASEVISEARDGYGREIAFGSMWLAAIALKANRHELAQSRCADATEFGSKFLQGQLQDMVKKVCYQVASSNN